MVEDKYIRKDTRVKWSGCIFCAEKPCEACKITSGNFQEDHMFHGTIKDPNNYWKVFVLPDGKSNPITVDIDNCLIE